MLIAMGIAAFLSIFIGTFPHYLYDLLPFQVDYEPYTYGHVMGQLQLLFFSAMAFTLLLLAGIYPAEIRAVNVDFDWFYRKGAAMVYLMLDNGLNSLNRLVNNTFAVKGIKTLDNFFADGPARITLWFIKPFWQLSGVAISGPDGMETRFLKKFRSNFFSIGVTAVFTIGFLLLFLIL
jgi:multicomponent Na+:H+ antiporter subunit D